MTRGAKVKAGLNKGARIKAERNRGARIKAGWNRGARVKAGKIFKFVIIRMKPPSQLPSFNVLFNH